MSTKNMRKFEDDELACCPVSGTPWYIVYISAYAEYFLVFQREIDSESGLPKVTFWKLDGKMADNGSGEYEINGKLRVHFGQWRDTWSFGFNKLFWYPGTSLCNEVTRGFESALFPMILDLQCPRGSFSPRRNQLLRCWTVPKYIHAAMCYPGRGSFNRATSSWQPMEKSEWWSRSKSWY